MLEYPEAQVIAQQINECIKGKKISGVTAAKTPHKLTWYNGDPQAYPGMLSGKTVSSGAGCGPMVVVQVEDATLVFSDGVNLRFHPPGAARPAKHQLLIEFSDAAALSAVVQMYGGIVCFGGTDYANRFYQAALEKPSVLSAAFDQAYFNRLIGAPEVQKLSLKALLATEQRIPGLGNGVLQDILYNARLHPKTRVSTLDAAKINDLYSSVVKTLADMVKSGGRDTEKDIFGKSGGYITRLSKNSLGRPCPRCGSAIKKEAYMGGSIYYCEGCQKI